MVAIKAKRILLVFAALLFAYAIFWLFRENFTGFITAFKATHAEKVEKAVQAETSEQKSTNIEFIEITVPDCNLCINFDDLKKKLRDTNALVSEKAFSYESADAKELIEKYKIKTVPTVVLRGDIDKVEALKNLASFSKAESNAMVFNNNVPVYYDLEKKRFVGNVKVTELFDSSCQQCFEPLNSAAIINLLYNVKVESIRILDINSEEGQELAKKHFIDFVPALIFSPELGDYNKELFASLGSFSSDGSFVVRKKMPPYRELASGEIKGLLSLTMIEASSCWACKDAKDMLSFLNSRLGLSFENIVVYDFNSEIARKFIEDYSIHYLPAAIVRGDTKSYELFKDTWPKIGKVFVDGAYVLDGYPYLDAGYYYDTNAGMPVLASRQ